MLDWLNEISAEYYILFGFLVVLFIFAIIQIIRTNIIARRLGTQDFKISEAIVKDDEGKLFLEITVSNQAFSTNNLNTVGFKNKSLFHPLSESDKLIPPRNKHVETFSMSHIESITIEGQKKFKKVQIYTENDLGDIKEIKAKVTNKYLKRRFKEKKKAHKLALKKERFKTGNYNFRERLLLVLKLFGRPFYKLNRKIKRSMNHALKESEVRRKQKAEHDKIEFELNKTTNEARTIKIQEESKRINKTRETELELLKQQKILEIETLKQQKIENAYNERKAEIESIDVDEEVKKHFEENPIDYSKIDEQIEKEQNKKDTSKTKEDKKESDKKETPKTKENKKESNKKETPKTKEDKKESDKTSSKSKEKEKSTSKKSKKKNGNKKK